MDNDNLNSFNPDRLENEELELSNNTEVGSKSINVSQIPLISPWQFLRPGIPGLPGLPGQHQQPGRPSYSQPPNTPPPYTNPQLPRGMAIPVADTAEFNLQYGDFIRSNNLGRQFRGCLNRFTFIWLWNGRTFWFYPIFINPWSVEGFVWNRGRWIYDSVNLNSIFFYQCF